MAELGGRLAAGQVATLRPPSGKKRHDFADGRCLYLQTTLARDGHINRSWLLKYEIAFAGRHEMGLGPIYDVSLADARERRVSIGSNCAMGSIRSPRSGQRGQPKWCLLRSSSPIRATCGSTSSPTLWSFAIVGSAHRTPLSLIRGLWGAKKGGFHSTSTFLNERVVHHSKIDRRSAGAEADVDWRPHNPRQHINETASQSA
jgi:hypothetical protein